MGLDMYLNRMPRYKEATAKTVSIIESYLDWCNNKNDPKSEARKYTLKDWCGVDERTLPNIDYIHFYENFFKRHYSNWDVEHKYGYDHIMEQVGYWRKANHIHNWFVENVQYGIDDCQYHDEVTKETLEELLEVCQKVLDSCELVDGQIQNGYRYEGNEMVPIMVDGKYMKNTKVAEKLLPTSSGFFFGGTEYDEYYIDDVKETIDIITKVLETTDFETEMIYYVSSW